MKSVIIAENFADVTNLLYFCDGFNICDTEMSRISSEIGKMEPGTIFFPSDLVSLGSKTANIRKALEREAKAGTILRLAQGVYLMPKIDSKYGIGVIYPSYEEVAKRLAERDKITIVPTGAYAQNLLGFSTQVPMNLVYMTDGRSKKISLLNGYTIQFVHTPQKNMAFKNRIIMMLVFALKDIGKENITEEHVEHIRDVLANIPFESIKDDMALMPAWIKDLITVQYEQQVF